MKRISGASRADLCALVYIYRWWGHIVALSPDLSATCNLSSPLAWPGRAGPVDAVARRGPRAERVQINYKASQIVRVGSPRTDSFTSLRGQPAERSGGPPARLLCRPNSRFAYRAGRSRPGRTRTSTFAFTSDESALGHGIQTSCITSGGVYHGLPIVLKVV